MKKCCFIIPYFGKFPNYFSLFLKSCEHNNEFEWIIFTDCDYKFYIPPNVKIIKFSFEELKIFVQSRFDFEIIINAPYKLCDYKPAYGYIFEEYIKEYEYWGHCDLDTIMGDMSNFLTDEFLSKYDKIFCLGHMVIYRNTYDNNRIFMSKINNENWYKESFENEEITIFDETYKDSKNVNKLFLYNKKRVFQEDWSINFKILPTRFVKTTYNYLLNDFENDERKAIYIWSEGKLLRYYIKENNLIEEEYLYMHLQERKMRFSPKILNENTIKIIPNSFEKLEVDTINNSNFNNIKIKKFNLHFIQFKIKWQIKKYKRLLKKLGEKK